jgi:hypothetical protein
MHLDDDTHLSENMVCCGDICFCCTQMCANLIR